MVDYQFLGMVAVVLAVVTRGSVLPVVAMTAFIALVMVAYEAVARRHHRRHSRPAGPMADASSYRSDAELERWMTVVDRALRSPD